MELTEKQKIAIKWLKIFMRSLPTFESSDEMIMIRKNIIWIRGGCEEVNQLVAIAEQELIDDACS